MFWLFGGWSQNSKQKTWQESPKVHTVAGNKYTPFPRVINVSTQPQRLHPKHFIPSSFLVSALTLPIPQTHPSLSHTIDRKDRQKNTAVREKQICENSFNKVSISSTTTLPARIPVPDTPNSQRNGYGGTRCLGSSYLFGCVEWRRSGTTVSQVRSSRYNKQFLMYLP